MTSNLRAEDRLLPIDKSPRATTRVLIADRDSMSSDLLASALARDKKFETVAIKPSSLMAALANSKFEVVVIAADLDANEGSAFNLVSLIGRSHRNTDVVMLINGSSDDQVIRAFRAGVHGVFSRQQSMSEFLNCVEHVRNGFIWAGRQETNALLEAFRSIPAPAVLAPENTLGLTARELQVVQSAARGKTNKTIAIELGLSDHTVKNYLFRAFEKLGVSSRVELLYYLMNAGHTPNVMTKNNSTEPNVSLI